MKVTLIEPRPAGKHVFSTVKMPRLGLPILGTILKEKGHQVNLIYEATEEIRLTDLINTDLVSISTTTSTIVEAYRIADFARQHDIPVVMGGAHVTFMVEEALQHCDYVCRGEADETFNQLVSCIEKGELPVDVPGVSYWQDDQMIHNPMPDWVNVDEVPFPDLSLLKDIKMSTYPVMTSRGCPFDCTFCSVTPMFGRKYRYRNTESVLEELKQYRDKQVFFVDDNFTANPHHSKELLRQMISRNIRPRWWCTQVRTDAARDEELLRLMRDAGCGTVFIGMESINPETLKKYNKKQDVEDIEYCIKQFHRFGILVHGMFVFGGDDDTVQTIHDTLEFAIKNHIDTLQFMILTPLPGTRTYADMEKEGRILTHDWNLYDAHHVVYQPRLMSAEELQKETIKAFHKFYSPGRILGNLFRTGIRSVAFRAVGFWLVRSWESENSWYYQVLKKLASHNSSDSLSNRISRSISSFRFKNLRYVTTDPVLNIEVSQQDETFLINLKGYLNDFSLGETFKILSSHIPSFYQNLVINLDGVNFTSEKVALQFVNHLNRMAARARQIQIRVPQANDLITRVIAKYNLRIPGFAITRSLNS
ncbi:B12-binding domain-containing radical SAM protein [Syntrophomonas erecta]